LDELLLLPLQSQLALAIVHCSYCLGSLLVNQSFGLFSLLPHHCLLIRLLAFGCLKLNNLVSLDRTGSMAGKLCCMPLDLHVLLLGMRAKVRLLMFCILINFVLQLVGLVSNLLQRQVVAAEQ
jgi:hypothetical protein